MANLSSAEQTHISALLVQWRMLSDLAFSDLVLWIPQRKDRKNWPDGFIASAQIRPTTAATVFSNDLVGSKINWGINPDLDQALSSGEITKPASLQKFGEVSAKVEHIPVTFNAEVIAVISRYQNSNLGRSNSKLESNYQEIASIICQMVANANFPITQANYELETAPRVGDGLIRLDANGQVLFASPNARSALNRVGWSSELEQQNLGKVFDSVNQQKHAPSDDTYKNLLNGKSVQRFEFNNKSAILDLLVIPLQIKQDRIGAIVLLNNITELRSRDLALMSKETTIKEIHHRVKNNLQTVSALLRLQARRVQDPTAAAALEEAVRRVSSIALVHETLTKSSAELVEFDGVYELILANAIGLTSADIEFTKSGAFGVLDSKTATNLALILTELIHNAIEHGFEKETSNKTGKLEVLIAKSESTMKVQVKDSAGKLPKEFNLENASNLGMQIVSNLVKNELNGALQIYLSDGSTIAEINFPVN